MGNGRLCYPLTVMDAASRFLFACSGFHHPTHDNVRAIFVELFRKYGLPKAISSAGSYWFWGPGTKPGNVALIIENDDRHLKELWQDVRLVEHIHSDWSVAEERDANIYLCRKPRRTLQAAWGRLD